MKILFCDDELPLRRIVSMILDAHGHHVEVACDGQEALEKIQANAFDVLITDNAMTPLTGIELVEKLRAVNNPIKVIMASAFKNQLDAAVQDRLHLDGILIKPYDGKELFDCLKNIGC